MEKGIAKKKEHGIEGAKLVPNFDIHSFLFYKIDELQYWYIDLVLVHVQICRPVSSE